MNWSKTEHIEENRYQLPGNSLYIHYFDALNVLFRIENALRVFVFIVLKTQFLDKWSSISITSDDENESSIASIAKKRIAQDKNFDYLGYSNDNPLMYLTSGELIRIITSDSYWKHFKPYFLGSKEIMKNKLDEIGNIRNSLAHFRPIKEGDVDLIKQNSEHTLTKIERVIYQLMQCPDIVPSNTDENWYSELKGLSNEYCSFRFKQSDDERWVAVILSYNSPVIKNEPYLSSFLKFSALRLKVNNLLIEQPALTKYIIYSSEAFTYDFQDEQNPKFTKHVKFAFDRECLRKHHEEIKNEFWKSLDQIKSQVELISKDGLARGKTVDAVTFFVSKEGSHYTMHSMNDVLSNRLNNEPAEYWGNWSFVTENYISSTDSFPWMRVNISEDKTELPF